MGLVLALMVAAATVGGTAAKALAQDLQKEIAAVIGRTRVGNATIGISIVDVQSGRELGAYKGSERLIPASNLKLLTSGSALAVLGADYEFRTSLERHGNRLVIKGAGDPAFADPVLLEQMNLNLDAFISKLVESVTKTGMTRCDEIIVDDRVFDRTYVHPDWPKDQLDKGYCAEVSGLNFHANVLRIFASPGSRDSEMGIITTEPSSGGIEVKSRVRTVKGRAGSTAIGAIRAGQSNIFTISGTVNAPLQVPAETTLHEPSLVFARILASRLASAGVVSGDWSDPLGAPAGRAGDAPLCRLANADEDFTKSDATLAVVRTPLSVVLQRCNGDSENLYAEAMLKLIGNKATGQSGTWANGASVVRMQVRDRLGPETAAALYLSDGSGMSRANKVTATMLAQWLSSLARDPAIGQAFVDSVPRARAEGTMRDRFRSRTPINEVRGKSGYIKSVRTLSGYVTDPSTQRRVAYSVLINGDMQADAKGFHEEIVMIADRWLAKQTEDAQERLGGGEPRRKK